MGPIKWTIKKKAPYLHMNMNYAIITKIQKGAPIMRRSYSCISNVENTRELAENNG